MFPEWTAIVGFLIGSAIGSFLNVVIYRLPLGLSINHPKHSFCPSCKNRLAVQDLVPLFSWLLRKGKCRQCGAAVPARYFWVEALTGALWALIWYQQFCLAWDVPRAICYFLMVSILVAATFIDLRWFIIPDELNALLLVIGLGFNVALIAMGRPEAWTWGLPSSIAGALVGTLVLWGITFLGRLIFQKDAMGHGDIKLARGIGACLFPLGAMVSFGLAIILGAVLGVAQVIYASRTKPVEEETTDDEPEPPESIGSILKSGVGYFLAFDAIGLIVPKLYVAWFNEDPRTQETVEEDDWQPGFTTIPFGPYLAAGAVVAATAHGPIKSILDAYIKYLHGD